ncbi:MAG: S1 RNA-binding domain-containing protein [Lachnospiraceae bacterium]|jgi:predicted RNA-binding protein (virulence factor B family)|nr:S1 RNA-binding domain-containing protein [Lachnospiraceae bacterium]
MIELGKRQKLTVVKEVEFGVYLGDEKERVLLPGKQVPEGTKRGDELEVFIYRDSADRLIATVNTPKLALGEVALLKVSDVTKIGAFLDWGLEKELLLPFKEQTKKVMPGEDCLAALYIDKSGRLCATMKLYHYLGTDSPYKKDDTVTGRIYEISGNFGVFVAVDDKYSALIPKNQMYGEKDFPVGNTITARVSEVKEDGKLDLSVRQKAYLQMDEDAERLMAVIESFDGVLPFSDKANPEVIRRETGMSKNEFKRAAGRLYKERRIEIGEKTIRKIE